jgi:hypothetical protein
VNWLMEATLQPVHFQTVTNWVIRGGFIADINVDQRVVSCNIGLTQAPIIVGKDLAEIR